MSYISKDEVKEIRSKIKKEFPNFKWSVINRDYSEVVVSLMEGKGFKEFSGKNEELNEYYLNEYYGAAIEAVFEKVLSIVYNVKPLKNYLEGDPSGDIDYNYYISLNIGKWDRPYRERAC